MFKDHMGKNPFQKNWISHPEVKRHGSGYALLYGV